MARNFNGTSDFIQLPAASTFGIGPPVTIAAWLYPTNLGAGSGFEQVFGAQIAGNTQAYKVYLNNQNLTFYNGASNGGVHNDATITITNNSWQHIGITNDGTNTIYYYNGSASSGSPINTGGWTSFTPSDVRIGTDSTGSQFVAGRLVDVAVWNVKLTAAEFAALGKGTRPYTIRPLSLIAWYPLDGLQSPEPDLSGNKNNGTLTGTTSAFGAPVMQFTPRWPQFNFPAAAVVTGKHHPNMPMGGM